MAEEKKDPNWMQNMWRPAMGWMYMLICLLDMAVFPVLWSLLQATMHQNITQWNPLTLQGAGLFHIAMGAVLGIAAFGRTQEKLAGTAANPMATTQTQNINMTGNTSGGFGSTNNNFSGGFNNPANASNSFGSPATNSFGSPPVGGGISSMPRQTGNFNAPAAAIGGAAVGAAAGFGVASSQSAVPMMTPPQPSRPPLEDDHPELD